MEKDQRQVAEWYNNLSTSYDELYGKEQSYKHQTILELLGERRFQVLLDIGCGTGAFLKRAHRSYDYGIGIDLSTRMLQFARNRRTPNTDYVLASSSLLPIRTASIDCAVSISTTKADPNLPGLIADVERTAREKSVLAMTVFEQPGTPTTASLTRRTQSTRISERETLYLLQGPGL